MRCNCPHLSVSSYCFFLILDLLLSHSGSSLHSFLLSEYNDMPRTQRPICTCMGCAGNVAMGPRVRPNGHDGKCSNFQQNAAKYGSYCGRCASTYLCQLCDC